MAATDRRHHPLGAQQKHEPLEVRGIVGIMLPIKSLVGVLVGALRCVAGTACRPSRRRVSRTEVTTIQSQGKLMA